MKNIAMLFSFLLITAMVAISYYGWTHIPAGAMIDSHWDMDGNVNGRSPRDHILIGMPTAALFVALLFAAIPKIDPRADHVKQSSGLLLVGWFGALATLLVAHGSIVYAAVQGVSNPLSSRTVFYFICALFVIIGNFTAKSRSNFFLGVRNPWTLSSEHAWSVANRLGGWLFVLTGASAAAATALQDEEFGAKVLVAGILTTLVTSFTASYFAWRNDPERRELR